jgi:ribosomal protein L14
MRAARLRGYGLKSVFDVMQFRRTSGEPVSTDRGSCRIREEKGGVARGHRIIGCVRRLQDARNPPSAANTWPTT